MCMIIKACNNILWHLNHICALLCVLYFPLWSKQTSSSSILYYFLSLMKPRRKQNKQAGLHPKQAEDITSTKRNVHSKKMNCE